MEYQIEGAPLPVVICQLEPGETMITERGSGETMACGTGACAAVVAAVAAGQCEQGRDITVRVRGGDLVVNYTDEAVTLTGDAKLVYTGTVEY